MRSLPLPGSDRRRRARQKVLYAVTAERIAVAEDQRDDNQSAVTKIRSAVTDGFLTLRPRRDDNS